jgi:hypothetical protein
MARNWISYRQAGMIVNAIHGRRKQNNKIQNAKLASQRMQVYNILGDPALANEHFGEINRDVVCPQCHEHYAKMGWKSPDVRIKVLKLGIIGRFFTGKETVTKAICTICTLQWFLSE